MRVGTAGRMTSVVTSPSSVRRMRVSPEITDLSASARLASIARSSSICGMSRSRSTRGASRWRPQGTVSFKAKGLDGQRVIREDGRAEEPCLLAEALHCLPGRKRDELLHGADLELAQRALCPLREREDIDGRPAHQRAFLRPGREHHERSPRAGNCIGAETREPDSRHSPGSPPQQARRAPSRSSGTRMQKEIEARRPTPRKHRCRTDRARYPA